ncbi:MAG: cation diffusion facilitator family transporter [Pseudomonadota bacterium]|mgnify:FL=1|nr:cation diffusion facilitator family transporter [Qipengyuania flava]MAH15997.1 divalent metal cation transporter FieF [Sphingomonadaceae bacterium]MEC7535441.1 cation diffusion facilitator family transporter [Pseudomonadota bacterium]HCS16931.1 divalent metal cation transporter FieF [Erythrobacter sp.]MCA0888904.1 cation diffusion facilitator family transporter [Qipengyuania flava]MED5206174.1 cation diffusion facilitator family transporter [Pseudomonadota bacterium]
MSEQRTLARSAAIASITVAVILVALKSWASWRTGSTAMLGSLADSALDLIASLATLTGVWIASMPADEDHRFGHGKAEALAAIFQVMLIALSAFGIAARAIMQLAGQQVTAAADEGIAVSLIAIVLTFALLAWQRHVMNRTRSLAIQTDHLHYKSDLLLNLAVIAALVLDQYAGLGMADPLFGLAIAIWLAIGAWRGASDAVDDLMDREWPEEKRSAFVEVAARHPELSNLHDLRTRTSGNRDFVQFHVDLPPTMTIARSHAIIERVEEDLREQFPGTEILIHIDPEGHVDEPGNPLVEDNEFAKLEKDG